MFLSVFYLENAASIILQHFLKLVGIINISGYFNSNIFLLLVKEPASNL